MKMYISRTGLTSATHRLAINCTRISQSVIGPTSVRPDRRPRTGPGKWVPGTTTVCSTTLFRLGATSFVVDSTASSLAVVASSPRCPDGCNMDTERECHCMILHSAGKISHTYRLVNEVPNIASTFRSLMNTNHTWIQRSSIRRCNFVAPSGVIFCRFALIISRCYHLLRSIYFARKKDLLTIFGTLSVSI